VGLCGYRLPTEAELEYACRAGAVTSRYYRQAEELLAEYGWYLKNSKERSWPLGGKKPNDLGLFDMHGNVWNWCQESYQGYYAVSKVVLSFLPPRNNERDRWRRCRAVPRMASG
jgi:formylglycine-generating enzyme required for sulfatase activity